MKTCLVIGLNSFTGKYVEEVFTAQGYAVKGTVLSRSHGDDRKNIHVLNLLDAEQARLVVAAVRPDVVVHLAGISYAQEDDVSPYYMTHVVGTRNLLAALAEAAPAVGKILLASTAHVYGPRNGVISETTPVAPSNDYAVSKLAMEFMARLWMDRLPVVITRPFNYTGIGQEQKFLIPKIVEAFRSKAETLPLGNTDVSLDFSDVRYIAESYLALAERGAAGEVYNLCSGVTTPLADIIAMLEGISGHKIRIEVNPEFVRANDHRVTIGSNEKLRSIAGSGDAIPLSDTLEWMYQETRV